MKRAIRIANCSGAIGDGLDQLYELAKAGGIDAITGDYLAEFNLAWRAIDQQADASLGYEASFLEQLAWHDGDAARLLAEKGIKVVHDGGALNPRGLAEKVAEYLASLGIAGVAIAWVAGDNVTEAVRRGALGGALQHLDVPGTVLAAADIAAMLTANAYTGQAGVVRALQAGADIVICGRCCDASPVMGLASWWHGWSAEAYDALAGSLVAGHLIECGAYVTGGNFAGVYELPQIHNLGYPIVEIAADGSFVLTKNAGTGGAVTVDTCTAQLLYEIQGPRYLNTDVTAHLETAVLSRAGPDRVRVAGIRGSAPPPTTKLAVCLRGGFQAEFQAYCVGLDTEAKFQQMRAGVLARLDQAAFSALSIDRYGSAPPDPASQAAATVTIRFFAQASSAAALAQLGRAIFYNGIQGYCGMHASMDWRQLVPRPFVRYFPALVDQALLPLTVHVLGSDTAYDVPARDRALCAAAAPAQPLDPAPTAPMPALAGGTVRRPLGDLVFARSGDKGGNANVGVWVRDAAAFPWLRAFLTTERLTQLLGDDYAAAYAVERCEFPNLRAVHFVVRGMLQEGVSSSSIIDGFGKSVGEFLRARAVDLPAALVAVEDARRTAAYQAAGRVYEHT